MQTLFRGKRKDGGGWVEGFYYEDQRFLCGHSCQDICIIVQDCEHIDVIPESVGPYIGKDDVNGKKIFGGHIVEYEVHTDHFGYKSRKERKIIKLEFTDFDTTIDGGPDGVTNYENIKIIGNTTDNPELIKEN